MKSQAKETAKEIAIEQINEMLSALSYDRIRIYISLFINCLLVAR